MADAYEIVCVNTAHEHEHITEVGTGTADEGWDRLWSVAEVRDALAAGTRFYTVSPSTKKTADVDIYDCDIDGCKIQTIRSTPDAIEDNNLDNIGWKCV